MKFGYALLDCSESLKLFQLLLNYLEFHKQDIGVNLSESVWFIKKVEDLCHL